MKRSLLIAGLCISLNGFSQLVFNQDLPFQTLDNHYAYIIDSTNNLPMHEVLKNQDFKTIKTPSANFGRDVNVHWLKIPIKNPTDSPVTVYLQNSHPFIDNLAFFQVRDGLVIQEAFFEYQKKIKINLIKRVARPTLQLVLLPQETALVFVKFQNSAGTLIFDSKLLSEDAFLNATLSEERIFNILLGTMVTFSVLAFCFFIISHSAIYLYYGLYVLFLNIGIQCQTGRVYNFFDTMSDFLTGDSSFRFYGSLAFLAHIFFLKELFNEKPWRGLYKYLTIFMIALGVLLNIVTLFDWGFIYYKINSVVNVYVLFLSVFLLNLIYQANKKKKAYVLYLVSFTPMILLVLYRILTNLDIVNTPINFSYFTPPVLALESLILLVGLSRSFIENLLEKNKLEKQLKTAHIETQESERRKIASDLHDDLGSTLALLKDNIERGNESSKEIIKKAINDLRSISHQLMPQEFEKEGFKASLERFIKQQGLKIELVFWGENKDVQPDKELNIYRIITELVHNARKHGSASEINIQITYRPESIHLAYEEIDNYLLVNKFNGLGLKSIESRLQYLGAKVLENRNGQRGYIFVAEIPI